MTLFKCKMCGGTLEINNNETVATCEYCGTQQTLPKLDDDRKTNLYDRANHFRRNNEFDKAMGIYEQILNEDNTDAEAYWSIVLCRYGIEYVKDPASHKRVPTVNRASYTSVFDDNNYKSALQYADSYQKAIYEEEAKVINEIQKGILAISQKEEPFDVFICYKETDNSGRRTPDSVLANDLYHQLIQEGFKVFFSRITLEDKLGAAYEPYIFAALNSAKVMVVLGTKPEFFNAVWVKNEWSRYLALIKNGAKKMLIPAYKDMDPYDLPEEFSHLQAQDMSKLGFMQDLIRGIKKIVQVDESRVTVVKETVVTEGNANVAPLLKRVFMFLEDGDWSSADEYCEKVLDMNPENAQAYLGKLMVELHARKQESLKDQKTPFDDKNNYQKVIRFADDKLRDALKGYIDYINIRNENTRLEVAYAKARNAMESANSENEYKNVAEMFKTIINYKESATFMAKCLENAEIARKDEILFEAKSKMFGEFISNYEAAIKMLESISGWKDADEQIGACDRKIEALKEHKRKEQIERERQAEIARKEKERRIRRSKKIAIIMMPIVCALITYMVVLNVVIIPNRKYNDAVVLMEKGNIKEAYNIFATLGNYKDSAEKAGNIRTNILKNCKVGDYFIFGCYEQDGNDSNGKEDIEWLILDIKEGKVLLISKYALDCRAYNTRQSDVTWETCTLRKWLNNDFINVAFSDVEKGIIPTVTLSVSEDSGNDTQDKVFLLSKTEANRYFDSNSARQCEATYYAETQGYNVGSEYCWWWLRSHDAELDGAAGVSGRGEVADSVGYVDVDNTMVVRPALWIDLNE